MARIRLLLPLFLALAAGCRPSTTSAPAETREPAWFEDVTAQSGLNFSHDAGPITPAYFLPQSFGSGVAVFDFDGDGRTDVFVALSGENDDSGTGDRAEVNASPQSWPDRVKAHRERGSRSNGQ